MSFVIRSAADQTVADRMISAPRSINFCPPEVSVFIFWSIVQERTLSTHVLQLYHTLHVCLQKVCDVILINATSPHGLNQCIHFLKHCTRENAFDTSVIVISHTVCLPAKGLRFAVLHLFNTTSPHGFSQRIHFLKHCTRENAFDTSVIVIAHTAYLPAKWFAVQFWSMLHLLTDSVSVFIFWSIVQERTLSTHVLQLYHTLHVCLQKVCDVILINATSPHGLNQCIHFLKHCTRENAFDTSVIVISHTVCLPAKGLRFAVLHLFNTTSPHGFSQRIHFLKHCTRENAFDTSVIVIAHTAYLPAKWFAVQFWSMLHLLTDSLAGWKLCLLSTTRCETLSP